MPHGLSRKAVMEEEASLQNDGVGTQVEGRVPDAVLGAAFASSI